MSDRNELLNLVRRIKRQIDEPSLDGRGYVQSLAVKENVEEIKGGIAIEGLASTPSKDRAREVVRPEAFALCVRDYLEKNPVVLWQHDHDEPIGICVDAKITPEGLWVRDEIYGDTAVGDKAVKSIRRRTVRTLSIGYIVQMASWHEEDGDPWAWREITLMELLENSPVSVPCNRDSLFEIAKSLGSGKSALLELATGDLRRALQSSADNAQAELRAVRELAKAGKSIPASMRGRLTAAREESKRAVVELDAAKALLLSAAGELDELLTEAKPDGGRAEEALSVEAEAALARVIVGLGEVLGR